jgi:hypothetical protein
LLYKLKYSNWSTTRIRKIKLKKLWTPFKNNLMNLKLHKRNQKINNNRIRKKRRKLTIMQQQTLLQIQLQIQLQTHL